MKNKKIINSTPNRYRNIKFKSQAEARAYKTLLIEGYNPKYEEITFELSPKVRPTVPFYNRTKSKDFHLISEPISPITYTPDFTFKYNGILIVIEVKGFENDVFPVKRNLFRKYLETVNYPVMYFEVRTKKELLKSLEYMKKESKHVQNIRKLIPKLPEKDISVGIKLLEERDFESLLDLVNSALAKIKKDKKRENPKYAHIDVGALDKLSSIIMDYML